MKRPYRSPLRWTLLPLMIVAMGCGGPEPESDGPELIIETSYGRVEGAAVDDGRGPAGDVLVFRGIPYAAPPVGELRWRPPEPPASWEGVRSAHESGAPCWQGITPDTSIYSRGELDRSEDCLYLDLWTAAEAPGGGKPRPVMVWFHGGSHEMGHGSSLIFDGAALARKGVVLVSINYRLGSFGFLAHAGLSAESEHGSSGNYGLLDKIAALEWVQANAGAFGGDPERVLIFGQSAGSMSVCSLVASPLAAGLFHRAIGQSAGCFTPLPTLEQAEERGALLAAELGAAEGAAPESAVSTLRAASAEDVLAAAGSSGWSADFKTVVDGWYLPDQPAAIYARGEHNRVPMMVGSMGDESSALFAPGPPLEREELEEQLAEDYGEAAEGLLAAYAAEAEQAPGAVPTLIRSDTIFGWGSRTWVRHASAAGGGRVPLLHRSRTAGVPALPAGPAGPGRGGRSPAFRRLPLRRSRLRLRQRRPGRDQLGGPGSRDRRSAVELLDELCQDRRSERRGIGPVAAVRRGRRPGARGRRRGSARRRVC